MQSGDNSAEDYAYMPEGHDTAGILTYPDFVHMTDVAEWAFKIVSMGMEKTIPQKLSQTFDTQT